MSSRNNFPSRVPVKASDSEVVAVVPVLAKVAAELPGIPLLGPLVGTLADLIKEHISRTSESMRREQEDRLADFYAEMLDTESKMEEQVAAAMVDDKDFHALLRACVADIEAEKVTAYANLAKGIASGSVEKQWRRHFLLSLRDLAADELQCLQHALVASRNQLIPAQGSTLGQTDFLQKGEPGTPQSIWIRNLAARGLIHDAKLSPAGEAFTLAVFRSKDLTPESIGFRTWSGHNVAIINYEIGKEPLYSLCNTLQDELRTVGAKSTVMALLPDNQQRARRLFTMGIVVAREGTSGLRTHVPTISSFSTTVPTLLVHFGSLPDLSNLQFVDRVDASTMNLPAIVDAVRVAVLEKARRIAESGS